MENHFVNSTLKPITAESGDADQKEVLGVALKQVGFIPNMYANMVNLSPVLSTYLHGYAEFRSKGEFNPVEQEVVFLALSLTNGCKYCGAAHSMLADKMSGVPADILAAIREGKPIPDAKLQTLYDFTVELVERKGKVSPDTGEKFKAAGFTDKHVLSVILAASVKTLSNFSNHFFETELDDMFSSYKLD